MSSLVTWLVATLVLVIPLGIGLAVFTYQESQSHKRRHIEELREEWQ